MSTDRVSLMCLPPDGVRVCVDVHAMHSILPTHDTPVALMCRTTVALAQCTDLL